MKQNASERNMSTKVRVFLQHTLVEIFAQPRGFQQALLKEENANEWILSSKPGWGLYCVTCAALSWAGGGGKGEKAEEEDPQTSLVRSFSLREPSV